uniref:ARAD1B06138p n=1 Tax=Blastobotrys adeninivorans TaxID=409370 RepID=A0A060TB79_BLAAD
MGADDDKSKVVEANGVVTVEEPGSEESSLYASQSHVFEDPQVAEYYREVYENCQYECRHLFDPKFEWTKAEEKSVVRKTEFRATLWALAMFIALDVDRYNIQQATSDDMLTDLGLTTNDYNLGNTLNLVCFLIAELPSQLISKKLGPDRWIPAQLVLWSLVSLSQCKISGRSSFLATRALIGLLQGGFIPDIILWLSYFYTRKEFTLRIGIFYLANPGTSIISYLMGYGILHMQGVRGWEGWRWLFLIEGLITLAVGLVSFFMMPPSVVQTKTWFRPNGWYTEREEKIMVNRILRDEPSKGDMNNRQAVSFKGLINAISDYNLWPMYVIRILTDIGTAPVTTYLSLTLRKMGISTLNTNLLQIPYNALKMISMILIALGAEKFNNHMAVFATMPIWIIPCFAALRWWPGALKDVWGTYALLTVMLAHSGFAPLTSAWISGNSNSVQSRAVTSAILNMFSQSGGIIAANIYRADDAPYYHRGNVTLLAIAIAALAAIGLAKIYYVTVNKRRENRWNAMTPEERIHYIKTTRDTGSSRLDFRYTH